MPDLPAPPVRGTRLECHFSRGWLLATLLSCAGLAAAGVVWVVCAAGDGRAIAVAATVSMLLAVVLLARAIRTAPHRAPVVVIDAHGIHDRRWRLPSVPWSEIDSHWTWSHRGSRFLCLGLRDRERWLARMRPWRRLLARANERLGAGTLNVGFTLLRPGLDEALAFVEGLRDAGSR